MNKQVSANLMTRHPQIATFISDDDVLTKALPFVRSIELLIDPPIEPGGGLPNGAAEFQVFESVLERTPLKHFAIRSNHRSRPLPVDLSKHGKL